MKSSKNSLRALSALLIAVLLFACLPCAALAESFPAVVTAKSMLVALDSAGRLPLGTLPKGTVVTVKKHAKGVAKIQYKGKTGYAKVSDMATVESVAQKAVVGVDARIFKKAGCTGSSTKVKAGATLYVLATKGGVAQVVKGKTVGYIKKKKLITQDEDADDEMSRSELERLKEQLEEEQKKKNEQEQAAGNGKLPSLEQAFSSGKYSNEQLCYIFLVKGMGYNTAAAAGVLANINYESGFKTGCVGDGGTSYGICQWHASRKTRLTNYCKEHSLKADTLPGQLMFLKYELENFYPSVHRYLKSVSDTAQGAYDAAYYFCYNFEAPAARTSQSTKRGQSARSTYYPRYAKA